MRQALSTAAHETLIYIGLMLVVIGIAYSHSGPQTVHFYNVEPKPTLTCWTEHKDGVYDDERMCGDPLLAPPDSYNFSNNP